MVISMGESSDLRQVQVCILIEKGGREGGREGMHGSIMK